MYRWTGKGIEVEVEVEWAKQTCLLFTFFYVRAAAKSFSHLRGLVVLLSARETRRPRNANLWSKFCRCTLYNLYITLPLPETLQLEVVNIWVMCKESDMFGQSWTVCMINYPVVRRELRSGIHIPYIFPIQWGAKELLRVSQPSNSQDHLFWLQLLKGSEGAAKCQPYFRGLPWDFSNSAVQSRAFRWMWQGWYAQRSHERAQGQHLDDGWDTKTYRILSSYIERYRVCLWLFNIVYTCLVCMSVCVVLFAMFDLRFPSTGSARICSTNRTL